MRIAAITLVLIALVSVPVIAASPDPVARRVVEIGEQLAAMSKLTTAAAQSTQLNAIRQRQLETKLSELQATVKRLDAKADDLESQLTASRLEIGHLREKLGHQ